MCASSLALAVLPTWHSASDFWHLQCTPNRPFKPKSGSLLLLLSKSGLSLCEVVLSLWFGLAHTTRPRVFECPQLWFSRPSFHAQFSTSTIHYRSMLQACCNTEKGSSASQPFQARHTDRSSKLTRTSVPAGTANTIELNLGTHKL